MSVWQELHDAIDGNLRMSKRRILLDAYRDEIRHESADIVRSLLPKEPDGEADQAIAWALELAAQAVERGHS